MKSLLLSVLAICMACAPSESNASEASSRDGKLVVYTVNYPLAFFAEWIGGVAVRVECPVPDAEDPADWTPDADTIAAYQEADLVLLNGAGYARWVERAGLPASRTVNTSVTLKKRLITTEGATHAHGTEGEHSHAETATTTWLDLTFALEQARTITFVLSGARPEFKEDFEHNLAALEAELLELDERWRAAVATNPEQKLLASRPVYSYLDERLGLDLVSLQWQHDTQPTEEMYRGLEALLETRPSRCMLWEKQPLAETEERLAALGVASFVFDPCASVPEGASDFLDVMQSNARSLEDAFRRP